MNEEQFLIAQKLMDEGISSMNKMYESKVRIIIKEKVLAYRVSSLWSKF